MEKNYREGWSQRETDSHGVREVKAIHHDSVTERITNSVIESVFQRDTRLGAKPSDPQSLSTYDKWGNLSNPADSENIDKFRAAVRATIDRVSSSLTTKEQEYMSMMAPRLTQALVLDKRYIDKIYAEDLASAVNIPLDWFFNPDAIDQTHIRIGMGGEEQGVNSRVPAYLVSAARTVEQVKDVFDTQANFARLHELQDVINEASPQTDREARKKKATEVSEWVSQRVKQIHDTRNGKNPSDFVWNEYIGLKVPKGSTNAELAAALKEAWVQYTGQEADERELQQKYHYTEKLPKIVVFNAANAAIEINGMDAEKVYAVRDNSQKFIKAYIEKFHPELSDSLLFQNDKPWDEHDYYTQMLLMYTHDLIGQANGKKKKVDERLEHFDAHHRRTGHHLLGVSSSQLYADFHPHFFEDGQRTEQWSEKIPRPNIMEKVPTARNTIYHQGPPEIVFGAYRKLYSEGAKLSDFTEWLGKREAAANMPYGEIAESIQHRAQQLRAEDVAAGKAPQDFRNYLGRAINTVISSKESRSTFIKQLGAPSFQNADDTETAWSEYASELKAKQPQEPAEQIAALRQELVVKSETLSGLKEKISLATQRNDMTQLKKLAEDPNLPLAAYPISRAELTVQVGENPVYYNVAYADTIVAPEYEPPTMERYNTAVSATEMRGKRLKGTTSVTNRELRAMIEEQAGAWTIFSEGIDDYASGSIKDEWLQQASEQATADLSQIYSDVDVTETGGATSEEVMERMHKLLRQYSQNLIERVVKVTGLDNEQAAAFISKQIVPSVTAKATEQIATQNAVELAKLQAARADYKLLLADIDPKNPVAAEAKYHTLLEETFLKEETEPTTIFDSTKQQADA